MSKKTFSIRISEEAKDLLALICDKHNRKTGNMLEVLISNEASRLGLKLPEATATAPKKP